MPFIRIVGVVIKSVNHMSQIQRIFVENSLVHGRIMLSYLSWWIIRHLSNHQYVVIITFVYIFFSVSVFSVTLRYVYDRLLTNCRMMNLSSWFTTQPILCSQQLGYHLVVRYGGDVPTIVQVAWRTVGVAHGVAHGGDAVNPAGVSCKHRLGTLEELVTCIMMLVVVNGHYCWSHALIKRRVGRCRGAMEESFAEVWKYNFIFVSFVRTFCGSLLHSGELQLLLKVVPTLSIFYPQPNSSVIHLMS